METHRSYGAEGECSVGTLKVVALQLVFALALLIGVEAIPLAKLPHMGDSRIACSHDYEHDVRGKEAPSVSPGSSSSHSGESKAAHCQTCCSHFGHCVGIFQKLAFNFTARELDHLFYGMLADFVLSPALDGPRRPPRLCV